MYIRDNIKSLLPYSTARDEYQGGDISVWLDANESPYNNGVNRYPDPHQRELKQAIARLKGVQPEQVFIGNGSDEAIDLCFRIFCEPGEDNVVAIAPTYGMYSVAAAINNVNVREVPLAADTYALDIEAMLRAVDEHTRLMWVCSPNNPTGNAFPLSELEQLATRFDGVLVVDEAYIDFSDKGSMLRVLSHHPHVVAHVKYPYNVNGPTQREVMQRLATEAHDEHVAEVIRERQALSSALLSASCVVRVYPSDANFLLIKVRDADALYAHLVAKGIIVRNRHRVPGCKNCLRLTIGTPEENVRLLQAIQSF